MVLALLVATALVTLACASQSAATATDTTPTPVLPTAVLKPMVPMPIKLVTPVTTTTTPDTTALTGTTTPIPATVPPVSPPPVATSTDTTLPTIPLTIGEHTLEVELATTPAQRQRGLMFRESLSDSAGMLFVFPNDAHRSFWMRNTQIPLSIAFLDAEGRIINIRDMEPFDESSQPSDGPARYALEVNQGWFAERSIVAGDVCRFIIPPDVVIE